MKITPRTRHYFMMQKNRKKLMMEINELPSYLCNECRPYGFCRRLFPEVNFSIEVLSAVDISPFDIREYSKLVPLRVEQKWRHGDFVKSTLQSAYDAFHQDDFETALLLFRWINKESNSIDVSFELAVTFYIFGDFEAAANAMMNYKEFHIFMDFDYDRFLEACVDRKLLKEHYKSGSVGSLKHHATCMV